MKIKKIILFSLISLALIDCTKKKEKENQSIELNSQFEKYKNEIAEQLWLLYSYSGWRQSLGYENYKFDTLLLIPDESSRVKEIAFANATLDSLKKMDFNFLSSSNQTDYYMIQNEMNRTLWAINELKMHEWDPSIYNISGDFGNMLNEKYDELDIRLRHFYIRMAMIPTYYEVAKKNIKNPTKEHTQLAIEQNEGGIFIFEKDLIEALNQSKLSNEEKEKIRIRSKESIKAIKDFVSWLKDLKNNAPRSFRLGKDLYAKKFEFEIESSYTEDEIYQIAISRKKELHQKMDVLANQLWSSYMGNKSKPSDSLKLIQEIINAISSNHVSADSFQIAIEQQVLKLIDFIKEKNLIYIDPSKLLIIRKEPAYLAGIAIASVSTSGPYNKNGNTYYNVGNLTGWNKQRAESFLREYNNYTLQILNIHEAIPGHYTQLIYGSQSSSIIKSILTNNTMVEGWAVYTERMMLENGYGNNSPEMWLMYYKWHLRSVCNTILDYSVHTKNMAKEEAMHLLIDEAFQQKAEAEGKWRRVSLTQVQLCSYFTGYTEIYLFREEIKNKLKDNFDLKKFHEQFLSYGNIPVKYIKEIMLKKIENKEQ